MVIANASEQFYEQAIETVKCYSWHYNYTFIIIRKENVLEYVYNCYYFDFMFLRHCIVANYAQKYKNEIKYVIFIDSDIGVVNPIHKLENYLPKDEEDILFYDRIFNYEIAAGSYIIKNTLFARSFLKYFADYENKLPDNNTFSDNVALQAVFVDFMGTAQHRKKYLHCMKIYDYAKDYNQNMLFVSCMRYILKLMNEIPNDIDYHTYEGGKIKILRKLSKKRWVRDGWLTEWTFCEDELFHHGWNKKSKLFKTIFKRKFLANESICKSSNFFKLWDYDKSFKLNCEMVNNYVKIYVDNAYNQHMKKLLESNVTKIED
uniref:Glycosyltransferase n=1 Tax=Strongyloides venezuelensis TaxID=75913 RepID=A0A0K0F4G1_STRVS